MPLVTVISGTYLLSTSKALLNKKVTHLNFASGYRGGERQTTLLIQQLAAQGEHQVLVTRLDSELARRCQGIKNLEIIKVARPYIRAHKELRNSQILHAHETKGAQVAMLLNKLYKIPYIVTRRVDNPIKNNFFTRAMYSNASYCIALSQAIKGRIHYLVPQANVKVIPSAQTDFTINSEAEREIKQRFEGKFLVGNIGELENTHKGQDYLIKAIKRIAKEQQDIHFIFLGKGPDKERYQSMTANLNNVTFEGFVNNVGDYIACMQLFVFPSLNEGLGSILLDVMKLKVPVIASNTGGIPDIVINDQTGKLVEPRDSDAIYQQIMHLYHNREEADILSENAYQNTFNYSPQTMTDAYYKLYLTI